MSRFLMKNGLLIVFTLFAGFAFAQTSCVNYGNPTGWNAEAWNFPNMSQRKVTGQNFGNGFFRGYLEHLPASYSQAANVNKKYPVIIFFHGFGSKGNGTASDLCRLFKDQGSDKATHLAIPGRVERQASNFSPVIGGIKHEFIVISPQFNDYTRLTTNDHYPTAGEVDKVIDFVEATYRIDSRRIYLTGLSNGANMVAEYAASSLAHAKRVAAVMPVALCSEMDNYTNTDRGIDPKYIGQAKLKMWFVYCEVDNCGLTGQDHDVPNAWVNAIKAVPGAVPPRYTILQNKNPATLYNCSDTLTHDAWSRAYDPNFTASFTYPANGNAAQGVPDGNTENIYTWFANSTSAVLPVVLKDYTARFSNNKTLISWTTTDEKDNASFTIERAGADQHFVALTTIPGLIDHQGEQNYSYTDEHPLKDINYYRLVQTDVDGEKTYFEIKKVFNRTNAAAAVIVSPNPFQSEISAFISVDKPEKISVTITDMSGKVLKSTNGVFNAGNTEVKFAAHDFPKGLYLMRVAGETTNVTTKIVKK